EVAPTGCVHKPLSVLLIDDNPARAEIVESGLREAGYRLLARLQGTQDLPARVRDLAPDVVVVSTDSPSRAVIEDMRRSTEQQPPTAGVGRTGWRLARVVPHPWWWRTTVGPPAGQWRPERPAHAGRAGRFCLWSGAAHVGRRSTEAQSRIHPDHRLRAARAGR